jgi:hypothetical protein
MRSAFNLAALAVAAMLSACNQTQISNVNTAIAVGCPVLASIQSSGLKLNKAQAAAANTLALLCPPNPAPTAAGVVLSDVIAAYQTLAPLVGK